jgi:hypothetical protein
VKKHFLWCGNKKLEECPGLKCVKVASEICRKLKPVGNQMETVGRDPGQFPQKRAKHIRLIDTEKNRQFLDLWMMRKDRSSGDFISMIASPLKNCHTVNRKAYPVKR